MKQYKKVILDLCGGTGEWGRPWAENGFNVKNITLPQYDVRNWEINQNNELVFYGLDGAPNQKIVPLEIYGILAAPPCTMFSDARTNAKTPRDLRGGMDIVNACIKIIQEVQYQIQSDQQKLPPLTFWALENPYYGRLRWFLGHPIYVFDPWEFGDMYKKRTALWGHFKLPVKTCMIASEGRKLSKFDLLTMEEIKRLKGVNNMDYWKQPSLRQTLRSITPRGFAIAFYESNKEKLSYCAKDKKTTDEIGGMRCVLRDPYHLYY